MCQRYVKIYKWVELKEIHNSIYCNNKMLTPYQSYEFLRIVGLGKNDKNPFQTIGYKEQNFVLFDQENKPIAIAPLYSKKINGKYYVIFRGYMTSAGHLDLIYSPQFSYDDYTFLLKEIKKYYREGILQFDRIPDFSLTYKYARLEEKYEINSSTMVTIKLPTTYEEWLKSLSKSVRQNLRTAYNHLKTDGKTIKYSFYYKKKPSVEVNKDIIHLFSKRLCEHSKINSKLVETLLYG